LGFKPVISEVNLPIPNPFQVFVLKTIVGFGLVSQTNPRSVKLQPPSEEMLPPERIDVVLIESASIVVSEGMVNVIEIVKVSFRHRTECPFSSVLPANNPTELSSNDKLIPSTLSGTPEENHQKPFDPNDSNLPI
jgi:hypothetical protein